jgi:type IV pilus assembly protein PilV
MRNPQVRRISLQAGSMLLEVLIAILIFSFGVLAVVGLQATSTKDSSQARYRAQAMLLVDDVLGQMWISNRAPAALSAAFSTGGPAYAAWLAQAQATLPGVNTAASTIVVSPTGLVTIRLQWKAPNEPAANPEHNVVFATQISQ